MVCFGWAYSVQISNVGGTSGDGASRTTTSSALTPSRLARTPRALSALSDTSHLMTAQIQMIGNTSSYYTSPISGSRLPSSLDANCQQVPSLYASQFMSSICRQSSRVGFDSKLSLITRVLKQLTYCSILNSIG